MAGPPAPDSGPSPAAAEWRRIAAWSGSAPGLRPGWWRGGRDLRLSLRFAWCLAWRRRPLSFATCAPRSSSGWLRACGSRQVWGLAAGGMRFGGTPATCASSVGRRSGWRRGGGTLLLRLRFAWRRTPLISAIGAPHAWVGGAPASSRTTWTTQLSALTTRRGATGARSLVAPKLWQGESVRT